MGLPIGASGEEPARLSSRSAFDAPASMTVCRRISPALRILVGAAIFCAMALALHAQTPSAAPPDQNESTATQAPESQTSSHQTTQAAEVPASGVDFPLLRVMGGLALVLSLVVIAFLVARKIAPQYFTKQSADKNLKLIETLPMGEKRSIALIQIGDRRLLIGNTPQQISLLSTLEGFFSAVSEEERVPLTAPESGGRLSPFRKLYAHERNQDIPKAVNDTPIPPDVRAKMRQLRESLEG